MATKTFEQLVEHYRERLLRGPAGLAECLAELHDLCHQNAGHVQQVCDDLNQLMERLRAAGSIYVDTEFTARCATDATDRL